MRLKIKSNNLFHLAWLDVVTFERTNVLVKLLAYHSRIQFFGLYELDSSCCQTGEESIDKEDKHLNIYESNVVLFTWLVTMTSSFQSVIWTGNDLLCSQ